jgi:hypothetical protein
MFRSPTPGKQSILARHGNIPVISMFQVLFQQHDIFLSVVAFVAVLSDVLIIVIGAVPYSAGQIYLELLACSYTTMAILAIMLITITAVIIWRHKAPYMPRVPDTVAGVLSYVTDSQVLSEVEGCEHLTTRELENRIVAHGERYVYGNVSDMRGGRYCIVDINAMNS